MTEERLHPLYVAGMRDAAETARRTADALAHSPTETGGFDGRVRDASVCALIGLAEAIDDFVVGAAKKESRQ